MQASFEKSNQTLSLVHNTHQKGCVRKKKILKGKSTFRETPQVSGSLIINLYVLSGQPLVKREHSF